MKASIIKKTLVCALSVALVMAPVLGVSATGSVSSNSSVTVAEPEVIVSYTTTSSVGSVKSSVSGAFVVTKLNGAAITTPLSDISESYQLESGEKPYVKVWDMDPKKSNLAYEVIENAAAALGAEVGPGLQIEIGKRDAAGKYSLLSQDGAEVQIIVGIPTKFADADKTFAVVCVREGGVVSILPDLDADPNTVTFATTGGAGAYAFVKY